MKTIKQKITEMTHKIKKPVETLATHPVIFDNTWKLSPPITSNGTLPYYFYVSGNTDFMLTGVFDGAKISFNHAPYVDYNTYDAMPALNAIGDVAPITDARRVSFNEYYAHVYFITVANVGTSTSIHLQLHRY